MEAASSFDLVKREELLVDLSENIHVVIFSELEYIHSWREEVRR